MSEWVYATIQDIRDEGITTATASDERVQRIISRTSERINAITDQHFMPKRVRTLLNGRGGIMLYFPNLERIIDLEEIVHVFRDDDLITFSDPLVGGQFVLRDPGRVVTIDRPLELETGFDLVRKFGDFNIRRPIRHTQAFSGTKILGFREGRGNWRVTGTIGWMDICDPIIETELTADIARGDTTISVTSTDGMRPRDCVLIISDDGSGTEPKLNQAFIINDITDSTTIEIDPSLVNLSSPGFSIVYGRVPGPINEVAIRLAARRLQTNVTTPTPPSDLVIEERVDNYRYKLSGPPGGESSTDSGSSSGDLEADRILQEYTAPPMLEWA